MREIIRSKIKLLKNLESTKKAQYLSWIYIILFFILGYFKIYSELYILLGIIILFDVYMFLHLKDIKEMLKLYKEKKVTIKKLDFYFIKDSEKIIDKAERIINKRLLDKVLTTVYIPVFFSIVSFVYIFKNNNIVLALNRWYFILIIVPLLLLIIWSNLLIFIYQFPTISYTIIPVFSLVISAVIFSIFYEAFPVGRVQYFVNSQPLLKLLLYLMITILLYILFSRLPLYILRKIRSNTIFISAIVTLIVTLIPQLTSKIIDYFIIENNMKITPEIVSQHISKVSLDPELKDLLSQSIVVDTVNYVLKSEMISILSGYTWYIVAGLTLSILVGGLIISSKLSRKERFAQAKYRTFLIDGSFDYTELKYFSYLGGELIENQIFNNKELLDIVKQNELNIENDSGQLKYSVKTYLKKRIELRGL